MKSFSADEQYGHDKLNRLTSVDYGDGQTQSYAFDSMGNRTSKTDAGGGIGGTEAYSYNAANMMLSRAGNAYISDQNGNNYPAQSGRDSCTKQTFLFSYCSGGSICEERMQKNEWMCYGVSHFGDVEFDVAE